MKLIEENLRKRSNDVKDCPCVHVCAYMVRYACVYMLHMCLRVHMCAWMLCICACVCVQACM